MTSRKAAPPLFVVAIAAVLLTSCVSLRPQFTGFSSLAHDQVAIVGRIELDPPLIDSDQQVTAVSPYDYKNQVYVAVDDHWREIRGEPGPSDLEGAISTALGATFYQVLPNRPLFILKSVVYLKVGNTKDAAIFPGGFKASIQPGDRAVYIGTLRYHRNEFMEPQRVEIVDDYAKEATEFTRRFGHDMPLQRRLLERVVL